MQDSHPRNITGGLTSGWKSRRTAAPKGWGPWARIITANLAAWLRCV